MIATSSRRRARLFNREPQPMELVENCSLRRPAAELSPEDAERVRAEDREQLNRPIAARQSSIEIMTTGALRDKPVRSGPVLL